MDPWTAVHFGSGLALGLMQMPLGWTLALSTVYEVAEQFFERQAAGQSLFEVSGPESVPNALIDTAALLLGHWLGMRWNET